MAGVTPIDESVIPAQMYEKSFGPFQGASFAGAASSYLDLGFFAPPGRQVEIHKISAAISAQHAATTCSMVLVKAADGVARTADTSVIAETTASKSVSAIFNVGNAGSPTKLTVNTVTDVTPSTTENVLDPGDRLYLYSLVNVNAGALANLVIKIRYRLRPGT